MREAGAHVRIARWGVGDSQGHFIFRGTCIFGHSVCVSKFEVAMLKNAPAVSVPFAHGNQDYLRIRVARGYEMTGP